MNKVLLTVAVAAIGYLLGCISTGIIISRNAGVNIRNAGSKNTGASNVLRVLGLRRGLITFLGDFAKAAAACWIGSLLLPGTTFGIERFGIMIGGIAVIIGHNWPCFYSFKGGKGIASSTAVILFMNPVLGLIGIASFILVLLLTRYISLSSMTMLFTYFVLTCVFHFDQWFACVFAGLLLVIAVYRHRENIKRLLHGNENKINLKKKSDKP
ncbi:MAG TPA: glycerol-3-phosphate 1-O-acyltransferase PlsY [Candidatus Limiplasma sp.]|nr:glycerol-3-phosphate 1-O-acyltransferase PlsY [Candidatus Limiplasma sp.]